MDKNSNFPRTHTKNATISIEANNSCISSSHSHTHITQAGELKPDTEFLSLVMKYFCSISPNIICLCLLSHWLVSQLVRVWGGTDNGPHQDVKPCTDQVPVCAPLWPGCWCPDPFKHCQPSQQFKPVSFMNDFCQPKGEKNTTTQELYLPAPAMSKLFEPIKCTKLFTTYAEEKYFYWKRNRYFEMASAWASTNERRQRTLGLRQGEAAARHSYGFSLSVFQMETKKRIISKSASHQATLPSYQEFYLLFKAAGCLVTGFVTISITYKYCGQKV